MAEPTLADYVTIIYNLYGKFRQTQAGLKEIQAGYRYGNEHLIVFFMVMLNKTILSALKKEPLSSIQPSTMGILNMTLPCSITSNPYLTKFLMAIRRKWQFHQDSLKDATYGV